MDGNFQAEESYLGVILIAMEAEESTDSIYRLGIDILFK